jgi:hypothetical protein
VSITCDRNPAQLLFVSATQIKSQSRRHPKQWPHCL